MKKILKYKCFNSSSEWKKNCFWYIDEIRKSWVKNHILGVRGSVTEFCAYLGAVTEHLFPLSSKHYLFLFLSEMTVTNMLSLSVSLTFPCENVFSNL